MLSFCREVLSFELRCRRCSRRRRWSNLNCSLLFLFLLLYLNSAFVCKNSMQVLVSEVVSKYVESKCKRKSSTGIDTLRWALSPQHFLHPQKLRRKSSSSGGSKDESLSAAGIRLSRCSSATSYDEFFSVKTRFSRSSSMNRLDFQESSKHSIVLLELYHYEGWPFGLCKKAFLLPPLPKSPSDSWSWRKRWSNFFFSLFFFFVFFLLINLVFVLLVYFREWLNKHNNKAARNSSDIWCNN